MDVDSERLEGRHIDDLNALAGGLWPVPGSVAR